MDETLLEKLGLTRGEIKVYLALNKIGESTIGPIGKESRVSKSKMYDILDKLIEKGLAGYIIKQGTKYFVANDPHMILGYISKKEDELNKTKNQIKRHAWKFGLKKDLATLARCFGTSLDKIPEYPGRLSQWRRDILKRDEFRCQECGIVKNRLFLQAHHIIPRRDPDCDKYELNNGICLCNDCHDAIKNREYEVKDKYFNIVLSKEQNHDI